MKYAYPLQLKFRLIALAPRISVVDANGEEIFYIEQKVFALREAVKVFNNSKDKKLLFTQKADQIIDFGAKYFFRDNKDKLVGSIQQGGMRSLFQASYHVFDKKEKALYKIAQTNPWAAMLDSLLNIIPFAELVTGFILNPTYSITAFGKTEPALQMKKKPSLFESSFTISVVDNTLSEEEEQLLILSLLMIVQLERDRG